MSLPATLPDPDQYGNYWLGKDHTKCAAIFPAKAKKAPQGMFIASRGGEQGFLFVADRLRYFQTPERALAAMQRASNKESQ